jgi:hypothetical protein
VSHARRLSQEEERSLLERSLARDERALSMEPRAGSTAPAGALVFRVEL